ncbi:MAG: tetratricopeptide repeat protein, partial [bacterium]
MLNVKVRAYALTITLFLACPSIPKAQEFYTADQLKQEYQEVLHLAGKQQYDKAIQGLKRIIEKEPSFCGGYLKLVEIHKYKSAVSNAREYFKELITRDPKNANAYHGLGLVYHDQGDFQQSIENFRKSIDLGNRCASIYKDIVDAYAESHDLDGAIDYLNKLARVQWKNEGVYCGLGYAYARQKHWEQALVALEKALRLNPNLSVAYLEKQNIYYKLGKLQEALEVNQVGYKLAESSHEVELQHRFLSGRAVILKRLGRHQEAQQSIEEALAIAGQIGDLRSEGKYLGNRGAISSSVADYQKA